MKIVLIRISNEETFDCNYFTPKYYFETEWCLDMHGYLDREELEARIVEINGIAAANPLLSERAKKGLLFVFVLLFVTLGVFIAGLASQPNSNYVAPSVIQAINVIAYFVGRYLVNRAAGHRSSQFSEAIKILFDGYNGTDNPTANWKLKWRKVLSHYNLVRTDQSSSDITPKYAEEAEIELEINDALAEITECTIRFQLCEDNNKLERITTKKEELAEKLLSSTPPFNNTPRPDNTPHLITHPPPTILRCQYLL
ncbi:hypothetical protein RhiirC2_714481 [Rhizophagus irregularis]|uniref:Uncharacterized protein n=1 Tax=Rhizophagus irregularis TaxID=588596 RepID=A0A2N1MZ76_9GLOM|nr:hypothetical protein RhiirC2_714481 [Rhizophagus irregularis]